MDLGRGGGVRIARYTYDGGRHTGVVTSSADGDVVTAVGPGTDAEVLSLAVDAGRDPGLRPTPRGPTVPLSAVALLSPVEAPPSVRDFYAFEQHVAAARRGRGREMDPGWYEQPVFYFSNPGALLGPGDDVAVPARCAALDFELEVAAVVGLAGRNLPVGSAAEVVAGFCVLNDWSARDLQRVEMTQGLGPAKGKDFATSLGPLLVTPDELPPGAVMTARVNGREVSRATLDTLWWSWGEMLGYASESATLRPGDVVGSGTAGSGCLLEQRLTHSADAYPWLAPGDTVELEVEGIGVLANRVVGPTGPAWSPDPSVHRPTRQA